MIRADGLSKNFGAVVAAENVSFSAEDGKVTALLGPNGAGKSTTLRMLCGVLAPSRGDAQIDGISVASDGTAARRQIGALPHNAGLYDRLTARENIAYFGALHGLSKAELGARIDQLAQQLEMAEIIDRRVQGFSQGQKVKTAIARALVHDPKNVLLDEPTNGLDVMATRAVRDIVLQLKAEGRTVLFSSHVMQEVTNLCDHIVIISGGQVRFDGSPEALRQATGMDSLEESFVQISEAATGVAS
ncbi:MAG: ATP-binding cassette domain-containing protein [Pseudomonadaceae bacterium]|nr:ATP-binding cassette domain-containing protein [Pseudomonadaceae bacterium]